MLRSVIFLLFFHVSMFYLPRHQLWIPIPNYLWLKHFKNIYHHLSAPVLLQICFTWPLVFLNHRNTWLPFHYSVDMFDYSAACPLSGIFHFITISLLSSLWFLLSCDCLISMRQPRHLFLNLFKILPVSIFFGGVGRGHNPMSYPCTTAALIWVLNILNTVMSAASSSSQSLMFKMPHPHGSPLERASDSDISGFLRNAFKPLYDCPTSHRNTCFKFVRLFQVSHLFLQFHPLGLWGCLHWSSYFKIHLVFLSSIPKFSVQFEGLPCHLYTLSVCTSVSFCPSDERLEHPRE